MGIFATLGLITALSVAALQTEAGGWTIEPAGAGRGEVLSLQLGSGQSYRFECTPGDVIVTQTGVTQLLDVRTNTKVGDGPDAVMPEGAAMMALYSGKDPEFQPARAVKNPAGGWDLTIRVAKDDKLLNAMPKSKTMSLFTTGFTTAVQMSDQARKVWKGFLTRCRAGG
ncbi:hypothetical protein DMC47_13570 [Nostoc sp. 3335mG]|nr:hypothetical protein DMC47_13570 [Nostoc sp. 3335mG]